MHQMVWSRISAALPIWLDVAKYGKELQCREAIAKAQMQVLRLRQVASAWQVAVGRERFLRNIGRQLASLADVWLTRKAVEGWRAAAVEADELRGELARSRVKLPIPVIGPLH